MQIEDLPVELLARIFMHLDYRQRIRLESVCITWRAIALEHVWEGQRILRFSREMLHLDEPWKDKKRINSIIDELNRQQNELLWEESPEKLNYGERVHRQRLAMRHYWEIFTNPALYEQEKPSIQLRPLKAVLRRCAPFLDELHLLGDFTRFSQIFFQLACPFGRLVHLHINVHLNSWHLRKIQRHLAPQLLSLAVAPSEKAMVAFKELLANCNKLENLHIAATEDAHNLFGGYIEFDDQGRSSWTQTFTYSCSFMPSTLKCLLIQIHEIYGHGGRENLVNQFLNLLTHCPQLRYMPILINGPVLQNIEQTNPGELDKIIRLQFPYFIVKHYSTFPYIEMPEFRSLKAIRVDLEIEADKIRQIAICCPQLEHLGIDVSYQSLWDGSHLIEIQDLVTLHQFQRLSSLEICISFQLLCPDGERADNAFLEIMTGLDQIHPLRSLDFKVLSDGWGHGYPSPSLSQDYLLQMANQLKHLETFSCDFYLKNVDIDDMLGIGQFCQQLEQIFDSQEGVNKKSFKFKLLANGYEWDNYGSKESKNLLVEWQKGSCTKRSKMNWHCRPSTGHGQWERHQYIKPARSIVLNELITSQLGQTTSSMLFDSFGTTEEEEH